ncbi:hypothetical protein PRZ48_014378 [Zasmidium cellare]|uniref:FAD-binding domain-containing protein n=1 Tax=Zasmidium cellare TaxID=395010 RepID=A0ABR0DYK0_ZASCE|nr:hypothetical protein PRZ48_014378 [Zasmidium cellare]
MTGKLRVAVIGAGPAGLAIAIELKKLPFVEYTLYERNDRISEIGAGISIQQTTWRMLEVMGAAEYLRDSTFHRPQDGHSVRHYSGRTGRLLSSRYQSTVPKEYLHARCHRAELQNALLKANDRSHIRTSKRLANISYLPSGRVRLQFADGYMDEVDLLVGADGIRSVVRSFAFPQHKIAYTERTAYRTLVPIEEVRRIDGFPVDDVAFWHAPKGEWVYTCNLGGKDFELTVMTHEPLTEGEQERVSWGEPAKVSDMTRHFPNFFKPIQDLFAITPDIKRYAAFSGSRLQTVVGESANIALIGDASHPLAGAFGAGAGFALEDAYALTQSLRWAYARSKTSTPLADALRLFDRVRSPHYEKLYRVLDGFKEVAGNLAAPNLQLSADEEVVVLVAMNWSQRHDWIYQYNIMQDFAEIAEREGV